MIGALKYYGKEKKIEKDLRELDRIIKEEIKKSFDFTETEPQLDEIECQRRDGFIPSSHNKGGYSLSGMIYSLEEAKYAINDSEAREKIEKVIKHSEELYNENFMIENKAYLLENNLESLNDLLEYMENNDEKKLEEYQDGKYEWRDDEAVRFEARVMFNGVDENGIYHLTVDFSANWEFPYFRDGKGMSAFREEDVEIENMEDASSLISSALEKVTQL